MTLATCVIDSFSSGALFTRRFANPVNADIRIDGERAVDTGSFTFNTQTDVKNGYEIKYIQDVCDLTGLKLIMNFQDGGVWEAGKKLPVGTGTAVNGKLKVVDESGYDMDGYCTNTTSRYVNISTERSLHFTTTGDEVIIPDQKYFDNATNAVGSTSIIDFSGIFDIYIRYRCIDTTAVQKCIFSKDSGIAGLSAYITSGATGTVNVVARVSALTTNQITGAIQVNDGSAHLIRITRGSDGIIRLFVDNVADGTVTTSTNYTASSVPLVIGNDNTFSFPSLQSYITQFRVYCNAQLSDNDNNRLWKHRRQYSTMKFGGVVWNETDGTDIKTAQVRSYANLLNTVLIQPASISNVYTSKTEQDIMSDLVKNYLTDWSIAFDGSAAHTFPVFIAQGALLLVFQLLCITTSYTFQSTARKVILVESPNQTFGATTLIPFVNGIYDITDDGNDITGTTNYLEVLGTGTLTQTSETFTAGSTGVNTFTLTNNPINVSVTDNGVQVPATSLTVSYSAKTVSFSTTISHTIIISYSYSNTTTGLPIYATFSDSTSQTANGFLGKRATLNGITDSTSLNLYGNNYMTKYKDVNKRIEVDSPYLISFARVNLAVWVTNTIKGYTNVQKTITSYTMSYPSMKMTIYLGSFLYDSYDLDNAYAVAIANTNTSIINANTV